MLVAGRSSSHTPPYDRLVEEAYSRGTSGSLLPCRSAIDKFSQSKLESVSSNQYLNLAKKYVLDHNGIDAEGDALLFIAMLPLLHMEVFRLRVEYRMVQSALLETQPSQQKRADLDQAVDDFIYRHLGESRFRLRRKFEGLEENINHFARYVRSQGAEKWLEGRVWMSQKEKIREAIIEARAAETEARDYMQLQIGDLSISESRKSIQLSSQQMDEAKRGKKCEQVNRRKKC